MILKFLFTTLLIGQFIIPTFAEDVPALPEANQVSTSVSLSSPLTDDPRINFYIEEADKLNVILKLTLRNLNFCERSNKQLIEDHIQRRDFIQKLEVTSKGLDRTKKLAIQANSCAIGDSDRFFFNLEFSILTSMVGKDFSDTLEKVSTQNFFTTDRLDIPTLQAKIILLPHHDILTLSNAQSAHATLDTLTIQLLQNLDHLNIQQQQTESSLKIGAISSTLNREIACAYICAEKDVLGLIEDRLKGK
ncbi:MAG: hypothetical protein K0M45_11515 [Candidatus Paracaedibacteraceae bacterium]|nr:hypothetical protein [Candidatus Paracaedibacteraceae bacterium]